MQPLPRFCFPPCAYEFLQFFKPTRTNSGSRLYHLYDNFCYCPTVRLTARLTVESQQMSYPDAAQSIFNDSEVSSRGQQHLSE